MKHTSTLSIVALSALLSACGSSSDNAASDPKTDNSQSQYAAFEAITAPAYLNLESGTTVTKNENWHFSYQKSVGFTVNGGISGSGNIAGCAAHTPDGLYDADKKPVQSAFEALTRDNTEAAFNAITKTSCEESDFISDSINTYINFSDWASYNPATHAITLNETTSNGWIVRSAVDDGNGHYNYGRVKVSNLTYESGVSYAINFSVEQWDDNAQVFIAANESDAINFTNERQYWDMETNALVTANDNWELSIERAGQSWNIQVNASVSGNGTAGIGHVLTDSGSAFDVTNPKASGNDIYKFFNDTALTALSAPGNYGALHYNVAGGHKMWPTFTTYLFKDGDRYFKAQVVSNYGEDGTLSSGNLYVRYAEVTE
jgi:hypothetical protein